MNALPVLFVLSVCFRFYFLFFIFHKLAMSSELEQLRQEAEQLKNQIRVSFK